VWLLAERIGLSAIITVVAYAMTLARHLAGRMSARHRISSYAVWEVAVLVLNVLAFVLIGLQLRAVVSRIHGEQWRTYLLAAAAVCTTVILVRIAWTMFYATVVRWRTRRFNSRTSAPKTLPTYGSGFLAAWCGMRGIVTLAAALALPEGTVSFPHRDLIVFAAFCVVLSTLVLQGLTLRPLMQRLRLYSDDTVDREIGIARTETARAALRELDKGGEDSQSASLLRSEYRARLRAEESPSAACTSGHNDESLAALQRQAVAAQREALTDLRARQVIGEDAFHVVEEEIDLLDLTADARVQPAIENLGT
jgi:CPA1 family monovalent cation:H+ antiporter